MTNLEKLRSYYLPYRWVVYAGILCLLITNICQTLIPVLLRTSIDEIQSGHALLFKLVTAMIVLAILQALFRTASRMFILNASRKLEYQLRSDLFAHIQKLPPDYFNKTSSGQIMAMLTNDITFVRMLYGVGTLHITNTLISYVFTLSSVMSINWQLAILMTLMFPVVFLVCRRTVQKIFVKSKENQEIYGQMSDILNESFAGVRALKGYNAQEYREQHFKQASAAYLQSSMRLTHLRLFFSEFMEAGMGVGMVIILAYGGFLVADKQMSLGELVAFSAYLAILSWPTQMMGWVAPAVQRGWSAFIRLNEILDTPIEPGYLTSNKSIQLKGDIELQDLSFAYSNKPNILKNINLRIAQGERVLITGKVAAGKTTLLRLLSGLHLPASGTLLVGGHKINADNQNLLRQQVSFCPQEATIFSMSIADNIHFAPSHALDVEAAAHSSKLALDKQQFANGWATMVGERGITLSGGQKQRTALARALAKPHNYLLLDDPIAQLDSQTALAVWRDLLNLEKDRTIILASQRIIIPESFDQIIVMSHGMIAEIGKHQELLDKGGLYCKIYELQKLTLDEMMTVTS